MAKTSQNRLARSLYSLAANSQTNLGLVCGSLGFVYCCWNEGQDITHYELNAQLQRHSASYYRILKKKQASKHNLLWGPSFPLHQVFYFTLRVEKGRRKQVNYRTKYGLQYEMQPINRTKLCNQKTCFPSLYFQNIATSSFNCTRYTFFSKKTGVFKHACTTISLDHSFAEALQAEH